LGLVDVLHPVPLTDFGRKQFREGENAFIEIFPEISGISDIGAINFLRNRHAYASIVSGGGSCICFAHIVRDLLARDWSLTINDLKKI